MILYLIVRRCMVDKPNFCMILLVMKGKDVHNSSHSQTIIMDFVPQSNIIKYKCGLLLLVNHIHLLLIGSNFFYVLRSSISVQYVEFSSDLSSCRRVLVLVNKVASQRTVQAVRTFSTQKGSVGNLAAQQTETPLPQYSIFSLAAAVPIS